MPVFAIVMLIILAALVALLIFLYFWGKKLQKRQDESREKMEETKQSVQMLVIDKKMLPIKSSGLPQAAIDQTPLSGHPGEERGQSHHQRPLHHGCQSHPRTARAAAKEEKVVSEAQQEGRRSEKRARQLQVFKSKRKKEIIFLQQAEGQTAGMTHTCCFFMILLRRRTGSRHSGSCRPGHFLLLRCCFRQPCSDRLAENSLPGSRCLTACHPLCYRCLRLQPHLPRRHSRCQQPDSRCLRACSRLSPVCLRGRLPLYFHLHFRFRTHRLCYLPPPDFLRGRPPLYFHPRFRTHRPPHPASVYGPSPGRIYRW